MDEPKIWPLSVASTGLRFPHSPAGPGEPYSKAPLPAPPSFLPQAADVTGKWGLKTPGMAHRSLTISFLELFMRMWICSLVTMTPSVSSASLIMNLQGKRKLPTI